MRNVAIAIGAAPVGPAGAGGWFGSGPLPRFDWFEAVATFERRQEFGVGFYGEERFGDFLLFVGGCGVGNKNGDEA